MTDRDPYQDLLDESRHREALEERARERWLESQLREDARFVGTLTDLAEQGVVVTLRTGSGATHQGWLSAVGIDHVVLRAPSGHLTYVALDAVTDVRPEPDVRHEAAAGDRDPALDRTLAEVLARVVHERPRIHLRVRGDADGIAGQLCGVGRDVLSLRLDGGRGTSYVSLTAITELAFVS
ncbi:MAG TPA: hypothetical protein VGA36_01695 [Nitriliruptorales bacterium]